jgi:hypothetical protein
VLVVPGLTGIAGFHRRDDVDQPRVIAALLQHVLNHRFLADMALGDVLDRHPGPGRQRRGGVPHTISQRLREGRVIEDFDPGGIQKSGHPIRVADRRQGSRDHHTVIARQDARYPIVVTLRQTLAHGIPQAGDRIARDDTPDLLVPALPA